MNKIIFGVDPDSKAHGVAIYDGGELVALECMTLVGVLKLFETGFVSKAELSNVEVHIENVCGNNAAFAKRGVKNAMAGTAINRSVGKCQQAQIELERLFKHLGVKVVRHPISKRWKSQREKVHFEKLTGWKGRSNEDTRSAAYFGFMGLK